MLRCSAALRTTCASSVALLSLTALACTGELSRDSSGSPATSSNGGSSSSAGASNGGGTVGGGPTPSVAFAPAPGSFKRLTTTEFRSSLRALLGDVQVGDIEPDTFVEGFAKIGGADVAISLNGVEKYDLVLEAATAQVFGDAARRTAFLGCAPTGASDTACFASFIARFGRLAWRHPLTDAEQQKYVALTGSLAQTLGDTNEALRLTTKALLMSPYFLYRSERGVPDGSSTFWRYTSHELAGRLGAFLLNSTPDSALLDAADRDELTSVDAIRAQAERLLSSSAGRESVGNFATELFRLQIVASRAKDPGLFPQYSDALRDGIMREVPALLQSIVFDRKASALELFTTRQTFVNADLAKLYGLDATGLTSDSLQAVTLPETSLRAGLLGTGAFLSLYANQKEGSPTQRGKFIRQFLLCQEIPDPPPDVSTVIEDPPPGIVLTKREKLAAHREQPTCAGCHSLMDPLGLTLENFDAIGAYRDNEHGLPIDATGDFDGKAFNGPIELGRLLAESPRASECLVRNLYRYATGHSELDSEEPVVLALSQRFAQNQNDFQKLMLDLVTSDGFRLVQPAL